MQLYTKKKIFLIIAFTISTQVIAAGLTKKHETCVYSQNTIVSEPLYEFSKEDLLPKLEIVKERAQELCIGLNGRKKYPDNGIGECLYYSDIAEKGRYKGKRVMCVKHSCIGIGEEMDDECDDFNLEKPPRRRGGTTSRRSSGPPKEFVVNPSRTYKVIEKCHYGKAGHLSGRLSSLSNQELITKGSLVRRMAQEVCLSLNQLEDVPNSGIHSCKFYDQIASKGRYKGARIICVDFSCTPSGYLMDETCLNFNKK